MNQHLERLHLLHQLEPGRKLRQEDAVRDQPGMVGRRREDLVEGALTFPLMALVMPARVNLVLAGFASTQANHTAGHFSRWSNDAGSDEPIGSGQGRCCLTQPQAYQRS
jgi:hypothetical protein